MAMFSSEQLNFFKFSTVVLDEFPIALRKVFVYMWDTLVASKPGGQKWDNSGTVLNLFLSNEGGAAKVPTLNKFIKEWDCTALFKATLFAQTFAMSDGSGGVATLNKLYVKPHSLPSGTFHSSVLSPSGNQAETFALALDQLRLLRNTLCHQISTKKIDKTTLDKFLLLAKEAFAALGQKTFKIDDIGKLGEEDFPTARVQHLEDELKRERAAAIKFKQIEDHLNQIESDVKGVGTVVKDMKTGLGNVGSDVKEIKANVQDIKQAMRTENPVKPARLRIHIDAELVPGPDGETTEMVVASQASQLSLQSSETPTSSSQQQDIDGSATSLVTTLSNKSVTIATQNVLVRIAEMYLQAHNLSTPEDFSDFENYMARIRKTMVVATDFGCLIITVECGSLQILDELWEDYRTGHLNEMAQKLLVTEDILKEFNLFEVKLTTTILEEEYRACREYFLQFQELYSKVVETETTSEKETFSTMSTMDEPMDCSVPSGSKITEEESGFSSGYDYSLEGIESTDEVETLTLEKGTYKGMQLQWIIPKSCPMQGGLPFKLVFQEIIPEELDSAAVNIGSSWVIAYKIDKTSLSSCFVGETLPPGDKLGFAKVSVYSSDRKHYLGETVIKYEDEKKKMIEEMLLNPGKLPEMYKLFSQFVRKFEEP